MDVASLIVALTDPVAVIAFLVSFLSAFFIYSWLCPAPTRGLTTATGLSIPPHVPHRIPFVGSALKFFANPNKFLAATRANFGNIFSVTVFGRPWVFVFDDAPMQKILTAKESELSFLDAIRDLLGHLFPKDFVQERAHVIVPALRQHHLESFSKWMFEEINTTLRTWQEGKREGDVDFFQFSYDMIIRATTRCLIGREITDNKERFDRYVYLMQVMDPERGFVDLLKTLIKLPGKESGRERCHREYVDLLSNVIDLRRARLQQYVAEAQSTKGTTLADAEDIAEKRMREEFPDVIQSMIFHEEARCKLKKLTLANADVANHVYAFAFAAQTNSFASCAWVVLELLRHEKEFKLVMEEVNSVFPNGITQESVSFANVEKMVYLRACLHETLRLYFPGLFFRKCMNDSEIQTSDGTKYFVGKNSIISFSAYFNHRIPALFHNPDQWDPSRHLDPRNESRDAGFMFNIFGKGRHPCLGEKFAVLEISLIVATMLTKFDLKLMVDLATVPLEDKQLATIWRPKAPIPVHYRCL